jgi:hypothetical protein
MPASKPEAVAATPAAQPFIPQLCQGCAIREMPCSKLPILLDLNGPVEIVTCGLYQPLTPPAEPDKE